eukprot:scaffold8196_cov24-Prasinocladus_malaysianus.AAC.1
MSETKRRRQRTANLAAVQAVTSPGYSPTSAAHPAPPESSSRSSNSGGPPPKPSPSTGMVKRSISPAVIPLCHFKYSKLA